MRAKPKTKYLPERDARYKDRQVQRGFTQIKVWVPEDMASSVKDYAKNLRSEFKSA